MKKIKIIMDIVFILIIISIFNLIISNQLEKNILDYKEYVVRSGDTIWSIAMDLVDNNRKIYIKSIINDIKTLNSLNDVLIYEGQEILLPVY